MYCGEIFYQINQSINQINDHHHNHLQHQHNNHDNDPDHDQSGIWEKFATPKGGCVTPRGRRGHTAVVFQDSMYDYPDHSLVTVWSYFEDLSLSHEG